MVQKVPYQIGGEEFGTVDFPDDYSQNQIDTYLKDNYKYIENKLNIPADKMTDNLEGGLLDYLPGENLEIGFQTLRKSWLTQKAAKGHVDPEEAAYDLRKFEKRISDLVQKDAQDDPEAWAALQEAAKAETFSDAAKVVLSSPSSVIPVVLQSFPMFAPALAAGAATAVATGGVGLPALLSYFAADFGNNYLIEYANAFADGGVDINDPEEVIAALNDEERLDEIKEFSTKRAVPIAVFDTISLGIGGKLLMAIKNAGRVGLGAKTLGGVAEVTAQGTLGGLGEAAAQISSTGKIHNPGEVVFEIAAEGPTGAIEIGIGLMQKDQKLKKEDQTPEDLNNPKADNLEIKEEVEIDAEEKKAPKQVDTEKILGTKEEFIELQKETERLKYLNKGTDPEVIDDILNEPASTKRFEKMYDKEVKKLTAPPKQPKIKKTSLTKQKTATALDSVYNVIRNMGPGPITKSKIRKHLPKPIEVYLKTNPDIENNIYKTLTKENYLVADKNKYNIPAYEETNTQEVNVKNEASRIKKKQQIEELKTKVNVPKEIGSSTETTLNKKIVSKKNIIAKSLTNTEDKKSFKDNFVEGKPAIKQEFQNNKGKKVGAITKVSYPKPKYIQSLTKGVSQELERARSFLGQDKPVFIVEPSRQPPKGFPTFNLAMDYLTETANTQPGGRKNIKELKEASSIISESKKDIKPTPIKLEKSINDTALDINARVHAQRREEAKIANSQDPMEKQKVIDFFTSQDATEEKVNKEVETLERTEDERDNNSDADNEKIDKKLNESAKKLDGITDWIGRLGTNYIGSLYHNGFMSKNIAQLAVPIIGSEEFRSQNFEKLSKITLPFFNLAKDRQIKIGKALAIAKVKGWDPSATNSQLVDISPETVQEVNEENKLMFKPDDPALTEGIQLDEQDMQGVTAIQAMANFERNQITLQTMRRVIKLMNLNAPFKYKEAFYDTFKSSTDAFRKGVDPQTFGTGKNGRQFDGFTMGKRMKQLAKTIREGNDGEENSTSILLYEAGERLQQIDSYFDSFYLPTSRTGDTYITATRWVPDPNARAGSNQYKKMTVYWNAYETERPVEITEILTKSSKLVTARGEKIKERNMVNLLRETYKDEINQTVPEGAVDSDGKKIRANTPLVTVSDPKPNTLNQIKSEQLKGFSNSLAEFLQILPQDYLIQAKNPIETLTETQRLEELSQRAKEKQQTISQLVGAAKRLEEQRGTPTFLRASRLIPGYDFKDIADSFTKHINTYAAWNAKFVFQSDINEAYADIETKGSSGEKTYARAMQKYLANQNPFEFQTFRQLAFMFYLTDPSAGFMNLFQGIPAALYNGTYGGQRKAWKMQMKVSLEILRTLQPNIVKGALQNLPFDLNKLKQKYGDEIPIFRNPEKFLGTVVAPSRVNEYLVNEITERVDGTGLKKLKEDMVGSFKKPGKGLRRVSEIMGYGFTACELVNRLGAYVTSYKLTKDNKALRRAVSNLKENNIFLNRIERLQEFNIFKTHDELVNNIDNLTIPQNELLRDVVARIAVEETQFLYGKVAKPRMARHVGAGVWQFSEHPTMMLELNKRLYKNYGSDGKKAAALSMLSYAMLGGFLGIPLAKNAVDLINGIWNTFDKEGDEDLERWLKKDFLEETVGLNPLVAEVTQHGVGRVIDLDIGQRVALGNHPIISAFNDLLFGRHVFDAWKPPMLSLGQGVQDSINYYAMDDPRWWVAPLPKVIQNLYLGNIEYPERGYVTRRGKTQAPPARPGEKSPNEMGELVVTDWDAFLKLLGFSSGNIAKIREEAFAESRKLRSNARYLKKLYAKYGQLDFEREKALRSTTLSDKEKSKILREALKKEDELDFEVAEYNEWATKTERNQDLYIYINPTKRLENLTERLEGALNIRLYK